jgi:hypothetical protein
LSERAVLTLRAGFAANMIGGTQALTQKQLDDGPLEAMKDISYTQLFKPDQKFYGAFSAIDLRDAAARKLQWTGSDGQIDPDPCADGGRAAWITTPALKAKMATDQTGKARSSYQVRLHNPRQQLVSAVSEAAHFGELNPRMLRDGGTLRARHIFWSDHGPNLSRSGGFLTISFFIDEDDPETVDFFEVLPGRPRSKRVISIMGVARPVVLTLGMPEAEDGWKHVTGPLFHVANELMVDFRHHVKVDMPIPLLPYDFYIESTGVGNGNLTCDESCRLYDANQMHSHHDGYSLAAFERALFTDYTHLSTVPVRTWGYILNATNDWKTTVRSKAGKELTAAQKIWQGKWPGLKGPPLRWGQDGVSARLLTHDDLKRWGLDPAEPIGMIDYLHIINHLRKAWKAYYRKLTGRTAIEFKENVNRFLGGKNFMVDMSGNLGMVVNLACNSGEAILGTVGADGVIATTDAAISLAARLPAFTEFKAMNYYFARTFVLCALNAVEYKKIGSSQCQGAMTVYTAGYYAQACALHRAGILPDKCVDKYLVQFPVAARLYGHNEVGKQLPRHWCVEVQEKLNATARSLAKDKSNHGSSADGTGFDESGPLLAIAAGLQYGNLLNWSGTSASAAPGVAEAMAGFLAKFGGPQRMVCSAHFPTQVMQPGSALFDMLPQIIANLEAQGFVNGQHMVEIEGIGFFFHSERGLGANTDGWPSSKTRPKIREDQAGPMAQHKFVIDPRLAEIGGTFTHPLRAAVIVEKTLHLESWSPHQPLKTLGANISTATRTYIKNVAGAVTKSPPATTTVKLKLPVVKALVKQQHDLAPHLKDTQVGRAADGIDRSTLSGGWRRNRSACVTHRRRSLASSSWWGHEISTRLQSASC